MLHTLKLLLPALMPSWRFFDTVAPSPRIEFTLLASAREQPEHWREFRPRPARLSVGNMLLRLVWSPDWNESLFLVSCAERLMEGDTQHSCREILARLQAGLSADGTDVAAKPFLRFRLAFLHRQGGRIQRTIAFVSPVHRLSQNASS